MGLMGIYGINGVYGEFFCVFVWMFGNFLYLCKRRCNVGGISHVDIVRCAGFGMTICIFSCLYESHIINKFPICHFAFKLNGSSLIFYSIDTIRKSMMSALFYSIARNSSSIGKPTAELGGCF